MISKKLKVYNHRTEKQSEVVTLVGKRGAGKSTLILNLIEQMEAEVRNVLYYAPNIDQDLTLKDGLEIIDRPIITTDNLDELLAFLDICRKESIEYAELGQTKPLDLVVIDDSSSDRDLFPPANNKTPLCKAVISSRHIRCSFIITLHRFNTCPSMVRDLVDYTYVYPNTKKNFKMFAEETKIDPDIFLVLTETYLQSPRDFLLIDHKNDDIYFMGTKKVYSKYNKGDVETKR